LNNNNNNKYILLVDDEKDILFLYREWLKSDGYQIVSFDNPIEALNYLNKNDNISDCSLVITDYKMPQMSGLDLIKKIREKDSNLNIKTMIVSAYVKDDLLKDNSYIERIDKIIEKPVDVDTLKNEVTNLTNNKIFR
jgi:response regulator RpfG family c-di-GMP phosphodiesterase